MSAVHWSNHDSQREADVRILRKAFGEPPDSPTLGYYRELPDNVLHTLSEKAGKLNGRFIQDGIAAVGSVYAAIGSFAVDFKVAAVGFVVTASLVAADAYYTNKAQGRLRATIFDRAPE